MRRAAVVLAAFGTWILSACSTPPGEPSRQATSIASISATSGGGAASSARASGGTTGAASSSGNATSPGACSGGTAACGGACTNPQTDAANCGACGAQCPSGQVCSGGACGCRTGQTSCSGACTDTTSDPANCGACGTRCANGMVCSGGQCASGCGSLTQCGSSCVDTTGNSANCGSCGHACPADQFCFDGACQCNTGEGACGTNGACVDITTNVQHCGSCANACATGATCVAHPPSSPSTCACPTGQLACGGACVDPNTDENNCGACGAKCSASGTQCLFGGCVDPTSLSCPAGAMIGNTCTANGSVTLGDYWVNDNQWGVAGTQPTGQQCVYGLCQTGDLVGWGTNWNWSGGKAGVKTFASLVFGWQYGIKIANTGLPIQLSSSKQVNCGWAFGVNQTGTIDISYDTWLHTVDVTTQPNGGSNATPSEEVMIWVYAAGGAGPISATGSTPAASNVSIDGATWNLFQGNNGVWPVSSYVRSGNATTTVMNLMDFYADLVKRNWIPNTRYLSSVQPGTEVFTGSGTLTTNGFYCRVQ